MLKNRSHGSGFLFKNGLGYDNQPKSNANKVSTATKIINSTIVPNPPDFCIGLFVLKPIDIV